MELEGRAGEDFDAYKAEKTAEFEAALATGYTRKLTGISIPAVPDLADGETEAARDELIALEHALAYALTFTCWLEEHKAPRCMEVADQLDALRVQTRLDDADADIEAHLDTLYPLKKLDPEAEPDFRSRLGSMYDDLSNLDGFPTVQPDIPNIPIVPDVCTDITDTALANFNDYFGQLEDKLTYANWLNTLVEECCGNLQNSLSL